MSAPAPAIPASQPIGGPFWTVWVPAALFALALGATWMLYRRFRDRGGS